jgi:hypothetical protein
VDYRYEHMTDWGRTMFVTPEIVVDGKLLTTDLVQINLGIRILLGRSYQDWVNEPSSPATRWATPWTCATRATRRPCRSRRSVTSTTSNMRAADTREKEMAQIRVGKPDVKPDTPAHTKGVHQGNTKARQVGTTRTAPSTRGAARA